MELACCDLVGAAYVYDFNNSRDVYGDAATHFDEFAISLHTHRKGERQRSNGECQGKSRSGLQVVLHEIGFTSL